MENINFIKFYFNMGLTYKNMLEALAVRHNVIMCLKTLKRILKKNGLFRRRYDALEDAVRFIRDELRGSGSLHGYRVMHARCAEKGMSIRKEDVRMILSTLDPEGTELRRRRRLSRRAYFAKGPNFIWHVDSYDKLKPFGICINGAIDGFSRQMLWLNAYNTSSDPKVVGGYYLETAQELGGCPRIVRTDMGTENSSIRDMQRYFRRNDTDAHGGERSFIYGKSTSNQRIESWWGFLRKQCVDFWLEHFHRLKDEGDFVGDFLDKNLMLFCFLALIQVSNTFSISFKHSLPDRTLLNLAHLHYEYPCHDESSAACQGWRCFLSPCRS